MHIHRSGQCRAARAEPQSRCLSDAGASLWNEGVGDAQPNRAGWIRYGPGRPEERRRSSRTPRQAFDGKRQVPRTLAPDDPRTRRVRQQTTVVQARDRRPSYVRCLRRVALLRNVRGSRHRPQNAGEVPRIHAGEARRIRREDSYGGNAPPRGMRFAGSCQGQTCT